jgi:8-oxo-dGTP diphosphatase
MLRAWQFIKTVIGIIFRHPVTGTTVVPILADGRIVLIRRRDTGQWGLPGGMVDWGEDVATTVRRELREETGLELIEIKRLIGVYSSPDRDPRIHSITISIEAEVRGTLAVRDTLEIVDVQAFLPKDLPLGNLSHDHDKQLQDYFKGEVILA